MLSVRPMVEYGLPIYILRQAVARRNPRQHSYKRSHRRLPPDRLNGRQAQILSGGSELGPFPHSAFPLAAAPQAGVPKSAPSSPTYSGSPAKRIASKRCLSSSDYLKAVSRRPTPEMVNLGPIRRTSAASAWASSSWPIRARVAAIKA